MRNILKYIVLVLIVASCAKLNGQDPHFSQFHMAPLELNPAMTGVFEGQYRLGLSYRDQWASSLSSTPFRTMQASADIRYHVANQDFFGVGVRFLRDVAGEGRYLQQMAHLNASFMKQLSGSKYRRGTDQYLIVGAQLGFGQNSLQWGNLWFGRQFDVNLQTIDFSSSSGEPDISSASVKTNLYLDTGIGLMYYLVSDEVNSFYVGGSFKHLNQATISLLANGDNVLYRRWTIHSGGEFAIGEKLSLLPNIMFTKQGPSWQSNTGTSLRYRHNDWKEIAFRLGTWVRVVNRFEGIGVDAVIASVIFEMDNWNMGLSYDITTSNYRIANNSRGAFELSLNYVAPSSNRRSRVRCPNF